MTAAKDGIEILGLSLRTYNALRRGGIARVSQLAGLSDIRLLQISGIGHGTLAEIRAKLRDFAAADGEEASADQGTTVVAPEQFVQSTASSETESGSGPVSDPNSKLEQTQPLVEFHNGPRDPKELPPDDTKSQECVPEDRAKVNSPAMPLPNHRPTQPPASTSPSLEDWEAKLDMQIQSLEPRGRPLISPSQCDEIAQLLERLWESYCAESALDLLESRYPVTFATYVITQGVYGRGDADVLYGAGRTSCSFLTNAELRGHAGRVFGRILERNQLSELHYWEFKLSPLVAQVELLGEIPLLAEECDGIGQLLEQALHKAGVAIFLKRCETFYPITFTVFLVAEGVYRYRGGDYWSGVDKVLGLKSDASFHHRIGVVFERIVKRNRLPHFPDMREHAARYVSLILAHGGVPAYCLKDYFANIIAPAVTRPQFEGLATEELIDELLRRSASQHYTDKPVIHFLENGGKAAVDFVRRSCQLARHWQTTQTALSPEEAGLPKHVVEFFNEWASPQTLSSPRDRSQRNRLNRPDLRVRPWDIGLFLSLPAQQVSAVEAEVAWEVCADETRKRVPVRVRRTGQGVQSSAHELRLAQPAKRYDIFFQVGDVTYQWQIEGLSSEHALLAFDPATGTLQTHLSAKSLWLLYPCDLTLRSVDGDANAIEELPRLPGGWSSLRGEEWDLSKARKLVLEGNGIRQVLSVRSVENVDRPHLVGGLPFETAEAMNQTFIYMHRPPALRIPFTHQRVASEELKRWQITLRSIGPSLPEINITRALSDTSPDELISGESYIDVRLDRPATLGPRPMGTFSVQARGPLGRDAVFTLRMLPEFRVGGLDALYVPRLATGAPVADLDVALDLSDRLEIADKAVRIEATGQGAYHLQVPGSVSDLDLVVAHDLGDDATIRVPVQVSVRRVRWRIVGDNVDEGDWSGKLLTLPIQVFLRQENSLLLLDLPRVDPEVVELRLHVVDFKGMRQHTLEAPRRRGSRAGKYWCFDLAQLRDTLRSLRSPIVRLELEGIGVPGVEGALHLPLVSLTQDVPIYNLHCSVEQTDTEWRLSLEWAQQKPMYSSVVYLWYLWRPWRPTIESKVPEESDGFLHLCMPKNVMLPGHYRLGFAIVDPWVNTPPPSRAPALGTPGTDDLHLVDPETRLAELMSTELMDDFESHLEQGLILQLVCGNVAGSAASLEWCVMNLHKAKIPELAALSDLTEPLPDLKARFANELFKPDCINRIVRSLSDGESAAEQYKMLILNAPPAESWSNDTCRLLTFSDNRYLRLVALLQMVTRDTDWAVRAVLPLLKDLTLSQSEVIELLCAEKSRALKVLENLSEQDSQARRLLTLLKLYSPGHIVRPGSWVRCNAGWGRIQEIEDSESHAPVEEFIEGQGDYRLQILLHIMLTKDLKGEPAIIDMRTKNITFPRAKGLFVCVHCEMFATRDKSLYLSHLYEEHKGALPIPIYLDNKLQLTHLEFDYKLPGQSGE